MSMSKKTLVADHLREALAKGDFEPGQRLPGEEELAEELGVSRATARLGMRLLQDEGRISIVAGRGAFAADPRPIIHLATPLSGEDSERFESGYRAHLRKAGHLDVDERVKVSLDTMRAKVARRLGEKPGSGLVVIRSSNRYVDGALWQSQITYLPFGIAGGTVLMSPEHLNEGVGAALRELGFHEEWNRDIVGARMPSTSEAETFRMGPGIPLLLQERVVYQGERPLRFTVTLMPADRHQLLYAGGEVPEGSWLPDPDVNVFER